MANDIRQRIIIDAADNTARGTASAKANLSKVDGAIKRLENTVIGFAGLNILSNVVTDLVDLSDTAVNLNGRLKLATTTSDEFTKAQQRMVDISTSNGTALEATVTLFGRINKPLQDLNFTLEQSGTLTQVMAEGLRISGASTNEAAGTMLQFSQAIQSGVLRGEELNSLMEQGGRITQALAAGLGVSTGRLKEMGAAGELTADKVVKALLSQADAIHKESLSIQFSFSQAMENIKTKIIDTFQNNTAINGFLADIAKGVATNFDEIVDVLIPAVQLAGLAILGLMVKWAAGKATVMAHTREQIALEEVLKATAERRAISAEAIARKNEAILAKELLTKSEMNVFETRNAATRARESQLSYAANIQRIKGLITELELQVQLGAAAVRSETNAGRRVVLGQQVAQTQLRLTAYTEQLIVAEGKLTTGTNALSVAVRAQQAAIDANTAARTRNGIAGATMLRNTQEYSSKISALAQANMDRSAGMATVATANLTRVGTALTGIMGRIGGALLGWPGVIAMIGYQVASQFVDMEVAAWALQRGLYRVLIQAQGMWDAMFNREQYKAALAQFDQDTSDQMDQMIALREAQAAGFTSIEAKQLADKKEIIAQEEKIEDARLRKMLGTRDQVKLAEDTLIKFKVENLKTLTAANIEMDEASAKSLAARITEIKFASEIENTLIEGTGSTFEEVQERKRSVSKSTNDAILAAEIESIEARKARWTADFDKELQGLEVNSKAYLKISIAKQERLASIDKDAVKSLGASLKEMAALRDGYLKSVAAGIDEIASLERSQRDFMREMQEGELTAYQESVDAQTRIQEVQDELRKISTLDQIADADKIKAIREQAIADIQSIARDEKSRAESLDKNTLDEITATQNKQTAMALYTEVVGDAIADREALNKHETEAANDIQTTIASRASALKEYQASITKADELVAKQRELLIKADTSDADRKLNDLINRLAEVQKRMIEVGVNGSVTVESAEVKAAVTAAESAASSKTYTSDSKAKTVTLADTSDFENSSEYIGRNSGGTVPGTGNTDTVPAMLTPGEFVIKKSTVSRFISQFGPDALYKINEGYLPNSIKQPSVFRNFGGSVSTDRVDRKVTQIKEKIIRQEEDRIKSESRPGKYTSFVDRQDTSWQAGYYDTLLELTDGLDGKEYRSVAKIQNQFGNALNILDQSTNRNGAKQRFVDLVELHSIIDRITTDIEEAPDAELNSGGIVPGTGDDDSVKAMLTPGEFVIKKESVDGLTEAYGEDVLYKMNEGIMPNDQEAIYRNAGGMVDQNMFDQTALSLGSMLSNQLSSAASTVASGSKMPQLNQSGAGAEASLVIELKVGDNAATGTFKNNDATLAMLNELKKVGLTSAK